MLYQALDGRANDMAEYILNKRNKYSWLWGLVASINFWFYKAILHMMKIYIAVFFCCNLDHTHRAC